MIACAKALTSDACLLLRLLGKEKPAKRKKTTDFQRKRNRGSDDDEEKGVRRQMYTYICTDAATLFRGESWCLVMRQQARNQRKGRRGSDGEKVRAVLHTSSCAGCCGASEGLDVCHIVTLPRVVGLALLAGSLFTKLQLAALAQAMGASHSQ